MVSGLVSLSLDKGFRCCVRKGSLNLLTSTGAIPSSPNPQIVFLGHTLLGGPIPQRLLGNEQVQKIVVAQALECATCQQ
eukprot:175031-Amphidinium_carterae.1